LFLILQQEFVGSVTWSGSDLGRILWVADANDELWEFVRMHRDVRCRTAQFFYFYRLIEKGSSSPIFGKLQQHMLQRLARLDPIFWCVFC
jgi:hypothetical protein